MTTALLVLDAQVNMFSPSPVYDGDRVIHTLRELVQRAHAGGVPVILVRNDGGIGEPDERGTPGWELHPALAPEKAAAIIDKDTPNPFLRTGLGSFLTQNGIDRLVVCGMQSEFCVDTAVRAAHGLGYVVVLASDAHSTYPGNQLSAEQIIGHHNDVLSNFATVQPASGIEFETAMQQPALGDLGPADVTAISAGLAEWQSYDHWLSSGQGAPYWPHTHPAYVADTLHQLWDPTFKLRSRYTDPPPWEMGIARTFIQPLLDTPAFVRKQAVQSITKAFDHLLQNPRNPLSPHINQVTDMLYSYDARDIRLFYVPHVTTDADGRERRYIFLLWAGPGVPERNPFAL